jgi:hypothetical protein
VSDKNEEIRDPIGYASLRSKARRRRVVLRPFLKTAYEHDVRSSLGKVFQRQGPYTLNDRDANVALLTRGTWRITPVLLEALVARVKVLTERSEDKYSGA